MEEFLLYEDYQEDLSSSITYMESSISTAIHTFHSDDEMMYESVLGAIATFIKKIIEHIQKMMEEVKYKISIKIATEKFHQNCKTFVKAYAKNKAAYHGKKVKFFDLMKYEKEARGMVQEIKALTKESMTTKDEAKFLEKVNHRLERIMDISDPDSWVAYVDADRLAKECDSLPDRAMKIAEWVHNEIKTILINLSKDMEATSKKVVKAAQPVIKAAHSVENVVKSLASKISTLFHAFCKKFGRSILVIFFSVTGLLAISV